MILVELSFPKDCFFPPPAAEGIYLKCIVVKEKGNINIHQLETEGEDKM